MANERRLIDARKLQKLVKEFRNETPHATARKYVCNVILSILGDENQTPTVDAIEVIRCKDCKQWMYECDDIGLCVADVPDIDGVQRYADDFCSYGEKSGTQPQREDVCGSG